MKTSHRRIEGFRHPGEAAIRRSMERGRQARSEALAEGLARVLGSFRSFGAKNRDAGAARAQESALTSLT